MSARHRHPEPQQQALHVTDYYCRKALNDLRAMDACNKRADRRLTDEQFDDNQFSIENGDGEIF